MAIDLIWDDDAHTILRMDIHGQHTWDGFDEAIEKVVAELNAAPHRVDLIVNAMANMPPGNPIPYLRSAMKRLEATHHYGKTVMITQRGVSSFAEKNFYIALLISGVSMEHHAGFFQHLAEARAALVRLREAQPAE